MLECELLIARPAPAPLDWLPMFLSAFPSPSTSAAVTVRLLGLSRTIVEGRLGLSRTITCPVCDEDFCPPFDCCATATTDRYAKPASRMLVFICCSPV